MSATKNGNPAFDRMMESARMEDETSHERYLEQAYLMQRQAKENKQEATRRKASLKPAERHSNPN